MKIVHASNFSLRRKGPFFYGIPFKLSNGLSRLGHFVFNFCDRDVADGYFAGIRSLGQDYANRKLMDVCEQIRPEVLLLGHCTLIKGKTLDTIRKIVPGIRIAHWNCDALFMPRNFERVQALLPLVDATFVTSAGGDFKALANTGGRVTFMPNPVDASIETIRVFEKETVENDLVFITGARQLTRDKTDICESIRNRIPGLKFDIRGLYGQSGVYGAAFFDVLGSAKMAINVSARNDVHLYSSDRMSQLVGCGLLTFVDRRTGFDSMFGEDELIFYRNSYDLIDKLDYYNSHDAKRREIANRGWRKAHQIFSETLVTQWIIDATFHLAPSHAYAWPTQIHGDACREIPRRRRWQPRVQAQTFRPSSVLSQETRIVGQRTALGDAANLL